MSEKLCLQWNDFQENVKSAFGNLREDKDFADVTLACEDGQQMEAHKVILAASSPFFQKLLGRNKHPHPLIYMRGMKSVDMLAIIDFLYCGEANVYQENLDSFLAIAEELQLKGLMGKTEENWENLVENRNSVPKITRPATQTHNIVKASRTTTNDEEILQKSNEFEEVGSHNNLIVFEEETSKTLVLQNYISEDLEELDEKVNSMMQKSENRHANTVQKAYICKACGKEGMGSNIKAHIEANHLGGLVCNLCGKALSSRKALIRHTNTFHG